MVPNSRAMPKSASFTWRSSANRMLAGLMSRWMMPWSWACLSARAELDGDVGDFAPVEASAGLELVFEAAAADQLHRIEEDAVLLAVAVEADDAFVAERLERFDLGFEAFAEALGLGEVGVEGLDGDVLAGFGIGRLVDRAHAAFADLPVDLIGTEMGELHREPARPSRNEMTR